MAKNTATLVASILERNVVDVIQRESLEKKLKAGKKLRIKLGADPTAPDLHLGHAVILWKLRDFQELGHKIVFIMGDFTAAVGDPSGRSVVRPVLTPREIAINSKTYLAQVGRILDIKKIEIYRNSKWLSKITLSGWMKILKEFTVSRILERDDFKKRLTEGHEVWLHEIMYPLLQAYDSVMVKADVELGGPDQLFNLIAGRHLQEKMGLTPQDILVTDYIVGLDGAKKMSKSLGNYIGITEKPQMMFGKVMSLPDEQILSYFKLGTRRSEESIVSIEKRLRAGENPREAKLDLATDIVSLYHGTEAGLRARAEFIRVFSKKELPSLMEEAVLAEGTYEALALLLALGFAKSKSEARRLIEQGGVEIIPKRGLRERLTLPSQLIPVNEGMVVRAGKTRFVRIRK